MTTPDKKGPYADIFDQVDEILNPGKPKNIILFSYPEFKKRWNSISIAEQYKNKAVLATAPGVLITSTLYLSGMRNEWWSVIPLVVSFVAGCYFTRKYIQAGG